jgi:hypothetical protein
MVLTVRLANRLGYAAYLPSFFFFFALSLASLCSVLHFLDTIIFLFLLAQVIHHPPFSIRNCTIALLKRFTTTSIKLCRQNKATLDSYTVHLYFRVLLRLNRLRVLSMIVNYCGGILKL